MIDRPYILAVASWEYKRSRFATSSQRDRPIGKIALNFPIAFKHLKVDHARVSGFDELFC